jgi:hypothetical protein
MVRILVAINTSRNRNRQGSPRAAAAITFLANALDDPAVLPFMKDLVGSFLQVLQEELITPAARELPLRVLTAVRQIGADIAVG